MADVPERSEFTHTGLECYSSQHEGQVFREDEACAYGDAIVAGSITPFARLTMEPKSQFALDAVLRSQWEELQRNDARAASVFYFNHILAAVVSYHQSRPAPDVSCELLISLMGFSPETTVLATTFVRPKRLVIVASKSAESYSEQCIEFLDRQALLAREATRVRFVDPTNHHVLHQTLQEEIRGSNGRCLVDLTGGKKVMSAVAGYAAWSLGIPICYLESRAYNEQMRRPEPGSEELFILEPPANRT